MIAAWHRPKDVQVVLDDKSFIAEHKSAILQAVDLMYDDEYDDTYDSMGVNSGGTDFKSTEEVESITDTGVKSTTRRAPAVRERVLVKCLTVHRTRTISRSTMAILLLTCYLWWASL